MKRTLPLLLVSLTLLPAVAASAAAIDPHLDRSLVPAGCPTCHQGHGEPGSPMLPGPQNKLCLSCHATQAELDRQVRDGRLSASAQPPTISDQLSQPYTHPLTDHAYSRNEPGAVVCTSCHSPHRTSTRRDLGDATGKAISTRDPTRFEYELCESCHGSQGVTTRSLLDISRLFDANSRSYHPVKVPSRENSPSLDSNLSGREIDCTGCHEDSNPAGRGGPHGSAVRHVLRAPYTTLDGHEESIATYQLCYECHDRQRVLDSPVFPEHRLHVVDERASCATCHSPHGSIDNRALMRFGEETSVAGVAPSMSTGRLAFESQIPGVGACYVTCHGIDHGPGTYGGAAAGVGPSGTFPSFVPGGKSSTGRSGSRGRRERD